MDPATMMMLMQMGMQAMAPKPSTAPQVTAQLPTSSFQQTARQTGMGPFGPRVLSPEELDAMEKTVQGGTKRQVTDKREVPESKERAKGGSWGEAAMSPEVLAVLAQYALAPQQQGAPSANPMNTQSTFRPTVATNPYTRR